MPYAGHVVQPRDIAAECKRYWSNYELTKAVAVALGESAGSLGAWHDNLDSSGALTSRDCGLFQINIPKSQVTDPPSDEEESLRTESLDPAVWTPVMHTNVDRAHGLYSTRWLRAGIGPDVRRWQPWVAYTSGWATFPEFWVWHQDADGNPVGPWIKTGRYIQRAIAGQMNFHLLILRDWSEKNALYYGQRYLDHFGVKSRMIMDPRGRGFVVVEVPPVPTEPPADGVGPRPVPNNGV